MRAGSAALSIFLLTALAFAADPIPPAPTRYFTQYTNVVSPPVAEALNAKMDAFERETSIQLLVAIFARLPERAVLEDFADRAFKEWKVGRAGKDNGAVLFIFVADRKMKLEVGYGLEGAIPDAVAKRIIEDEIRPAFARGDFNTGVTAGVNALIQASRGEYRGTGRTVGDKRTSRGLPWPIIIFLLIFLFVVSSSLRRNGTGYHRRRKTYWGGWPGGWGGGSWGGGGGGGGGWSGGGGGGVFSGGGGRSGGGGASGSW